MPRRAGNGEEPEEEVQESTGVDETPSVEAEQASTGNGGAKAGSAEEVAKRVAETAAKQTAEAVAKKEAEAAAAAAAESARAELARSVRAEMSAMYAPDAAAMKGLSEGLVGISEPLLEATAQRLRALHAKQLALIQRLAQEDRKVMTLPHMAEVAQALAHVPVYAARLQEMKEEMAGVTARVKGMRKRAQRLYTRRQQEDAAAAQSRAAAPAAAP